MHTHTRRTRLKTSPRCDPTDELAQPDASAVPIDEPSTNDELAKLAKALAHPTRVRILRMLARKEARMCSVIVDELPLAQSSVSEHLRILKAAGLIRAREDGPRVAYCVNPVALRRIKALVAAL
jgi:ArsR family transcriptional regulator, arsenate/arsenite/antimonite-responsive transcriptional repressor